MPDPLLFDPDAWCGLGFHEHRERLARALEEALAGVEGVREVRVEAGTVGREYDLTALVETDVGRLRTPLWSHDRATIFCDASIHPANREPLAPGRATADAADRLRRRLRVPYTLESRGLTVTLEPEPGVTRTWTAEHSRFRRRTAVTREDLVEDSADVDVRDLLAHFYTGPSLRLVGADGAAFLLPAAAEVEGPLVTLCRAGRHWADGVHERCPECGGVVEVVVAARPGGR